MPYNPSDPVLGADMTQGEWDQLRELMRKAEAGGKMNELLTVHKKEVKNAPMNRHYPPDDDEWKDCEESQVPPSPSKVHAPSGTNSSVGSADNKAPPGALWPDAYNQSAWKVPPIAPPPTLQQAGGNSGFVDAREYHKKWQDRPYDPNDDPWIEDVDKDPKNDKPVIQFFGNVVQKNADIAEAKAAAAAIAEIANRYCAPDEGHSAGFPKFNAQVPLPPSAKADPPLLPASAIGSEKGFQEQKGKGKNYEKGVKPELAKGGKPESAKGGKPEFEKSGKPEFAKSGKDEKGGKDDKGGKNVAKGEFKGEFKGEREQRSKRTHTACSQSFWFEVCTHLRRACGGC